MNVDKAPTKAQVMTMMKGVEIEGVHVEPLEVGVVPADSHRVHKLRVVVSEGKYHEVCGGGQGVCVGGSGLGDSHFGVVELGRGGEQEEADT